MLFILNAELCEECGPLYYVSIFAGLVRSPSLSLSVFYITIHLPFSPPLSVSSSFYHSPFHLFIYFLHSNGDGLSDLTSLCTLSKTLTKETKHIDLYSSKLL